jgi:PAS domain S-box-containing protein
MARLPRWNTYVSAFTATTLAYAAAALVGLQWSVIPGAGTAVWPAAGVAFAALVLGGLRLWPAVFVGRWLTAVLVASPQPWWTDLLVALATTAGAWVPAYLAKRAGGIAPGLGRMADMLWLTLGGAVGGALISASLGVAALLGGGLPPADAPKVWLNWWAGYLVGALTVAPLILAWSRRSAWRLPRREAMHLLLCLLSVAAASYLTFFSAGSDYFPAWYVYPPLVWAALAFQVRGASAAILVASLFALASAVQGVGILTAFAPDLLGRVLFGQQFVAVSAFTMLFLAAIADERRGTARLRESQTTTRLALQAGRMSSWRWDMRSGLMTAEGSSDDMFGYVPGTPLPASELVDRIHPDDRARVQAVTDDAIRSRRTFHFEYRLILPDGSVEWLSTSARPLFGAGGRLTHLIGVSQVITERKRAEEHRQLLVNELNHRVKNTLAIVQGIAQQSFKDERVPAEARQAFEGRLAALAAAHNVLTRESWEAAPLRRIVEDAVRPFGRDRFTIDGPDLRILPKAAVSLALTLHELATNAAKYGALSNDIGEVEIRWSLEPIDDAAFTLAWQERKGPPVAAPRKRGFGSRLIERGLAAELDGRARVDYAAEGVRWTITAPWRRLEA